MKNILCIVMAVALFTGCRHADNSIREAVEGQLRRYPLSTMQDVYKSFYQARFGSGHMIADTASVRAYLLYELAAAAADDTIVCPPFYEPVGANNAYVRVYLNCVNGKVLTAEQLFDAFVRSAVPAGQPEQSWADEWRMIVRTLRAMDMPIDEAEEAMLMQAALDNQAVHHSEPYRKAYRPHYRIVRRDIFDKELNPFIDKSL